MKQPNTLKMKGGECNVYEVVLCEKITVNDPEDHLTPAPYEREEQMTVGSFTELSFAKIFKNELEKLNRQHNPEQILDFKIIKVHTITEEIE